MQTLAPPQKVEGGMVTVETFPSTLTFPLYPRGNVRTHPLSCPYTREFVHAPTCCPICAPGNWCAHTPFPVCTPGQMCAPPTYPYTGAFVRKNHPVRKFPGQPTGLCEPEGTLVMGNFTWDCPGNLTSPHLTSPHLTSPHLTSPHLTSPHPTPPHPTPPHLTSPHPTPPHPTPPHLHLTSPPPHLTSPHLTSPHLTSPHLTSPHLTSPHLTSPHRQPSACGTGIEPSTSRF